jgi:hypothetical protein
LRFADPREPRDSGGMGSLRIVVVLGVVAGLAAVGLIQTGLGHERAPEPVAAPARSEVLDVLHGWDDARADAWAQGDVAALRRLYVAGSVAGRADARLLRRYLARGLVVRHLGMQVFAVRVLRHEPGLLRLVVTDRVAGGVAVTGGHRVRLPRDRPTTHTIALRRVSGDWRVASVS